MEMLGTYLWEAEDGLKTHELVWAFWEKPGTPGRAD